MSTVDEFDQLLDEAPGPIPRRCGTCALTEKHESLSSGGEPKTVPEAIAIWAERSAGGTTKMPLSGLRRLLAERADYPYEVGALRKHILNHLPRKGKTD